MPEVIPIGADHAGFPLKERLKVELARLGYQPLDVGAHSAESVDYPDCAHEVASRLEQGGAARGLACRMPPTGAMGCARRCRGPRRSPGWPGSTTMPTCSSCRPGS